MNLPKEVQKVFDKIEKEAKPISIFVYGSRARSDFKKESDYEVGVLFERDKKWGRRELSQLHSIKGLNLYPFIYEDFVKYNLDTPFPKAIYMRELIEGAKTAKGKRVVETMELPKIKLSDLLERISFDTAYALAAVLSSRQEDWITTSQEFSKSALFGARVLVIMEARKFPLTYDEIAKEVEKIDLQEEYKLLLKHALNVRKGAKLETSYLYTNISFLNQAVGSRLKSLYKKGDKVILKGKSI